MKILIVDDEYLIRNIIKEYCEKENYTVYEAENGEEAIQIALEQTIDVLILDLMMPKLDGYSAYREIKKQKNIPTIVLSARTDEYDKLFGFDLGIDDYLTKPFSPKELIARIKAITKRHNQTLPEKFIYKTLEIDFSGHAIYINHQEILLTPKEYELFIYLLENKNVALSREQLLNHIWGYDFYGDDRTIDTHIKMLRNSLLEYRDLIKTVRGMGYKLEIKEE